MSTSTMQSRSAPPLNRLTPVLVVDAVEPCIRFWVERFGLAPESDRLPRVYVLVTERYAVHHRYLGGALVGLVIGFAAPYGDGGPAR